MAFKVASTTRNYNGNFAPLWKEITLKMGKEQERCHQIVSSFHDFFFFIRRFLDFFQRVFLTRNFYLGYSLLGIGEVSANFAIFYRMSLCGSLLGSNISLVNSIKECKLQSIIIDYNLFLFQHLSDSIGYIRDIFRYSINIYVHKFEFTSSFDFLYIQFITHT